MRNYAEVYLDNANCSTCDDPTDYELNEFVEVCEQQKANFREWRIGQTKAKTGQGFLVTTANGRAKDYSPHQVRKLWERLREELDDSESGSSCDVVHDTGGDAVDDAAHEDVRDA